MSILINCGGTYLPLNAINSIDDLSCQRIQCIKGGIVHFIAHCRSVIRADRQILFGHIGSGPIIPESYTVICIQIFRIFNLRIEMPCQLFDLIAVNIIIVGRCADQITAVLCPCTCVHVAGSIDLYIADWRNGLSADDVRIIRRPRQRHIGNINGGDPPAGDGHKDLSVRIDRRLHRIAHVARHLFASSKDRSGFLIQFDDLIASSHI